MALVRRWDALILDIKSPLEFSVRPAASEEAFFLFKESLNENYSRHGSSLKLGIEQARCLNAGEMAVVLHDSRWCRALVQTPGQYKVKLWLLDYGQTVVVTVDKLYKLDQEFSKNKPFALRCHLANLKEATTPDWLAAAAQEMEGMKYRYGDQVHIHHLGDIQLADENDNLIFNDGNGFCFKSLPVNVLWSYTEASPFDPPKLKTVNLLDNLKTMQFPESLDELMDSLTETAEVWTTSDETECSKRSVEGEEDDPNFQWLNPEIPPERQFLASCTHVDDQGQVYIQLERKKYLIESMHDDLSSKYMRTKRGDVKLKEGSECIARWHNGRWYRGRILSYGPFQDRPATSEEVLVLFVDFGNASIIKKKNVRTNLSHKNLPIQAVRVVLHDVAPKGGEWSPECLDFLHQVINSDRDVEHSPVNVVVVENDEMPLKVNIQIQQKKGGWIDISQLLVAWRWGEESSSCNPVRAVETSLPQNLRSCALGDLLQHTQVGDTFKCKLASVVAYNRVVVEISVEGTKVVELAESAQDVPQVGTEVELGVVDAVGDEEVVKVVVGECLRELEEPLLVQMISANPPVAHIVDGDGKPVYSSLQEEGFIEIKTKEDFLNQLNQFGVRDGLRNGEMREKLD